MSEDRDRYLWDPQQADDPDAAELRDLEQRLEPARWRSREAPDVGAIDAADVADTAHAADLDDPDAAWERARARRAVASKPAEPANAARPRVAAPAPTGDDDIYGRAPPRWVAALIAAAAVILFLGDGLGWFGGESEPVAPGRSIVNGLSMEVVQGAVTLQPDAAESERYGLNGALHPLAPGDVLVCDADARARLAVSSLGSVDVRPGSRVEVLAAGGQGPGAWSLFLREGELRASIFAAPREFEVATPAGLAMDLGCVYVASVDGEGLTTLSVEGGFVAFAAEGREVLVPQGARIVARPGLRPGTPCWSEAPVTVRTAVDLLDRAADDWPRRVAAGDAQLDDVERAALAHVLDQSGEAMLLTLFHLGDHPAESVRAKALASAAERRPPPPGVRVEDVLAGDGVQRDAWLSALRRRW